MTEQKILIVDDDPNIRAALQQAVNPLALEVETAANGQEALERVAHQDYDLILLDLTMPGMDGLAVLHRVVELRPDIRVMLMSAHGTIETAVEAIKTGAVDFIQKPVVPEELRKALAAMLDPAQVETVRQSDYDAHLRLGKQCLDDSHINSALEHVRQAIALDPSRPEAFNLLGVLYDLSGDHPEAMKNYRAAVDLDPTYAPAWRNLTRPIEDPPPLTLE